MASNELRAFGLLPKCSCDLLFGGVLVDRKGCPNGSRNPADDGELEQQAKNACKRTSDGEEGRKGQQDGDE